MVDGPRRLLREYKSVATSPMIIHDWFLRQPVMLLECYGQPGQINFLAWLVCFPATSFVKGCAAHVAHLAVALPIQSLGTGLITT